LDQLLQQLLLSTRSSWNVPLGRIGSDSSSWSNQTARLVRLPNSNYLL
jgi:hypothetical protein